MGHAFKSPVNAVLQLDRTGRLCFGLGVVSTPQQKFFVSDDGKAKISITKAELQARIDSGKYSDESLAWTKGLSDWLPLSDPYWDEHGVRVQLEPPDLPKTRNEQISNTSHNKTTIIEMPKLSETMTVAKVVRWRKKKGDKVSSGDVLAEIETHKATMELESFEDGTLLKFFVEEGDEVSVGSALVAVGRDGILPANSSLESRNDPQKQAIEEASQRIEVPVNTPKHSSKKNTNKISNKVLGNLILTAFLLLFFGLPIYGFYWLFNYDTEAFIIVFSLSLGALIVWGVISGSSSTGNSSSRYNAMSMYQRQQQLNEVRKMNENMSEMNDNMSDFM